MKTSLTSVAWVFLLAAGLFGQEGGKTYINGYYTCLPYDDSGFSGKFADVVVDLPGKCRFVFSREYSYQPYWQPSGGKPSLVNQLIPRTGDGPKERPDKDVLLDEAVITANTDGETQSWSRSKGGRVLDKKTMEAMNIYGLTHEGPTGLTSLNRSWNFAPEIQAETGCVSLGYRKNERAYQLVRKADALKFTIQATKESPLVNPAFVVKNWDDRSSGRLQLKINGQIVSDKMTLKKGIEMDTDGSPMLVLWLKYSAEESVTMEID
jgi:hypothetical protein